MDKFHEVYSDSKRQRQAAEFHRYRVQHALHRSEFNGSMIEAPLPKDRPINILDSATGEGIWMIEEAANYPNATFLGTDIEIAGFEEHKDLPDQVSFRQQSVLDPWPRNDHERFDLVHQRYGFTNVPIGTCPGVVRHLLELVRPGGYIQLVDADLMGFERGEGHAGMTAMMDFMSQFFAQGGMDPSSGPKLEAWLKAAGVEDVTTRPLSFGMGKAAKTQQLAEDSTWNVLTLVDNFKFVCEKIPDFWYTSQMFDQLAADIEKEMREHGNSWKFWVVTGRKSS
ncbi:methyltransferase GliN [Pleomassaria siparia CBS 279.74]|uniref:Methyltransferase GliN n=1 Tax=Pleomassaria siparia CBS 279.74 TaxID=1314801 RepID=A0A6G1KER1_9PLEO|nr:methyltransferase GliN [Pleomassaria siparia CBS 279.74]